MSKNEWLKHEVQKQVRVFRRCRKPKTETFAVIQVIIIWLLEEEVIKCNLIKRNPFSYMMFLSLLFLCLMFVCLSVSPNTKGEVTRDGRGRISAQDVFNYLGFTLYHLLPYLSSFISMFHLYSSTCCGFDLTAIVSIYTSRDKKVTELISGKWIGKYFNNQVFIFLTNFPFIPVNHFSDSLYSKQMIGYLFVRKTGQWINMKIINKENSPQCQPYTSQIQTLHTIQLKRIYNAYNTSCESPALKLLLK